MAPVFYGVLTFISLFVLCAFCVFSFIGLRLFGSIDEKPNVFIVIADDWGWNDVGYHQNTDTDTSFIDELATEGLLLENFYACPVCTPSRASLFTGRHAFRFGLQMALDPVNPFALTRQETLLSEEFQQNGYSTHLIGKWHLGFTTWDYTPTYRGFDTFYGFYNGEEDYFTHNVSYSIYNGIDFRDSENLVNDSLLTFGPDMHFDKLKGLIPTWAESSKPFFTVLSMQASHFPAQASQEYLDRYDYQTMESRKYFQAQTTHANDKLQEVVESLKNHSLWDNTLLIFLSDNGGVGFSGDNSPLRGEKTTFWEGGIKTPAFISGGYLNSNRRGKSLSFPIHITDLYPSLLSAVGFSESISNQKEYDGMDLWSYIQNEESEENEDELEERELIFFGGGFRCETSLGMCGALRQGKWKLIYDVIDQTKCMWVREPALSNNDSLGCGEVPSDVLTNGCPSCLDGCLFDLESDPCEYYNIADDYPDVLEPLIQKMMYWNETLIEPLSKKFKNNFTASDPAQFGGYWTPWKTDTIHFESWLSLQWEGGNKTSRNHTKASTKKKIKSETVTLVYVAIIILTILCAFFCHCKFSWKKTQPSNKSEIELPSEFSPLLG